MMKFFTADRIHNGYTFETNPKIIAFGQDGTFVGLLHPDDVPKDQIEHYDGILMPGLINAHCHLELSHTKGLIPEHTGLVSFLGQVVSSRSAVENEKVKLIEEGFRMLENSGCIAVGDIANGTDTLSLRQSANMHVHTFVESMGFVPESAVQRFAFSGQVYQQFAKNDKNEQDYQLRQSIVPHAPYSVSPQLFAHINQHDVKGLISIHNEECTAENEYFQTKTGAMRKLYEALRINDDWFEAQAKNSLPCYLPYLDKTHTLLLVHNTCMDASDIEALQAAQIETSICLCPNANLYIENQLPNVDLLAASGFNICLGTDSLASNHQLNVYEEVLCLQKHFPNIGEETILAWASSGGAKALQMEDRVGCFKPNLHPGLVQLDKGKSKRIL